MSLSSVLQHIFGHTLSNMPFVDHVTFGGAIPLVPVINAHPLIFSHMG